MFEAALLAVPRHLPKGDTTLTTCRWGPLAEDWEALDQALPRSGGPCRHGAVAVRGTDPRALAPPVGPFFTVWKCSRPHHERRTCHPREETKAEELDDRVTLLASLRGGALVDRAWASVPRLGNTALSCVCALRQVTSLL